MIFIITVWSMMFIDDFSLIVNDLLYFDPVDSYLVHSDPTDSDLIDSDLIALICVILM